MRNASPQMAGKKWKDVTPGRMSFYQSGVSAAGGAYEEGVRGAGDRYASGVQQAISNGQWQAGVEGKGSRYAMKASTVGGSRWSDGVSRAETDYVSGVTPYLQAISGMSLPPRGPKGAAQNYGRSQAVGDALHAIKIRR